MSSKKRLSSHITNLLYNTTNFRRMNKSLIKRERKVLNLLVEYNVLSAS